MRSGCVFCRSMIDKGNGTPSRMILAMGLNLLEVLTLDSDEAKLPRLPGVVGLIRVLQQLCLDEPLHGS